MWLAPAGIPPELEATKIVAGGGRRAAEKLGQGFDVAHIVMLRLAAELADGHVGQHAAA